MKSFLPLSLLFTLTHALFGYKVGKCPKLASTWSAKHPGEELDHTRLSGYWQVATTNEKDYQQMECQAIRLDQLEQRRFQLSTAGVALKGPDFYEILVDNATQWIFTHPSDSS